jgi:hypothetical protein
VLLTAVWMHLDASERRQAMPRVAALTIDLAASAELMLLWQDERPDSCNRAGVSWSFLTFRKHAKDAP